MASRKIPVSTLGRALLVLLAALPLALPTHAAPDEDRGRPSAAALQIPFAHTTGDRYRLHFDHEVIRDGKRTGWRSLDLAVHVIGPLGRDQMIELRWLQIAFGKQVVDLTSDVPRAASLRDEFGGGRMRIRVDSRGTATEILDWPRVEAALLRAGERRLERRRTREGLDAHALAQARAELRASLARPRLEPVLLADWNLAYGACGTPLLLGVPTTRDVRVPRMDGGPTIAARDRRQLSEEQDADGRARYLRYSSDLSFGGGTNDIVLSTPDDVLAPPATARVRQWSYVRFDRDTRRLGGLRSRAMTTADRTVLEVVRFAEADLPMPDRDALPTPMLLPPEGAGRKPEVTAQR
jgi:hypothetical protein